jgi:hypothetical protein
MNQAGSGNNNSQAGLNKCQKRSAYRQSLIIKYQSYYKSKNQKTIIKQQVKQKNTNRYIQALTAGHTHLHRLSHHFEENTQRNTREKPEKQAFLGGIFEFQFSPTESVENASHTKTGQSKGLPNLQ